jgi:phosphoglycerate kinase
MNDQTTGKTKTMYKTIRDFDLANKRVLLRADLNVPAKNGAVTDETRISRLKPTIDYLRQTKAKILILSHFGRPEGAKNPKYSLSFLIDTLARDWGCKVQFAGDCIGAEAESAAAKLQPGDVLLLENVRFYPGEEKNDPAFAKSLAKLGDIYVNDAFSAAHRAHASTEGLAHLLPTAAGLLMEEELKALDRALGNPEKPIMAVAGGSKISTKLMILNNLVQKVDYLVLGGAMANTFLFAQGHDTQQSMCEKDMAEEARKIMKKAADSGCEIIVPIDVVTASEVAPDVQTQILPARAIPAGQMALDAGPETLDYIGTKLQSCKTVVWNGPLGVFEVPPFDLGTNALAHMVAKATKAGSCVSIAGGGDTAAALENAGAVDDFSYISTAGGAFLEWLEGKTLPGVAALNAYDKAA